MLWVLMSFLFFFNLLFFIYNNMDPQDNSNTSSLITGKSQELYYLSRKQIQG